ARNILSVAPASAGASNSLVAQQVHRKKSDTPSGMICSGKQTVAFFKLEAKHQKTIKAVVSSIEKNESKILRISSSNLEIEKQSENLIQTAWTQHGKDFSYLETLGYKSKLFIIGGGHCALALSELMSKMDFYISLFDDRPNLNTIEKNKYADAITIIES